MTPEYALLVTTLMNLILVIAIIIVVVRIATSSSFAVATKDDVRRLGNALDDLKHELLAGKQEERWTHN